MGLSLFSRCACVKKLVTVQPDLKKFRIHRTIPCGKFVIVEVTYENATNYGGRKLLVYHLTSVTSVYEAKLLDPHFCERGECLSPVARFEPTEYGMRLARAMCLAGPAM